MSLLLQMCLNPPKKFTTHLHAIITVWCLIVDKEFDTNLRRSEYAFLTIAVYQHGQVRKQMTLKSLSAIKSRCFLFLLVFLSILNVKTFFIFPIHKGQANRASRLAHHRTEAI